MSAVLNGMLIGFAAVALAVLVVLASPTRRCIRCHGTRVTRHRRNGRPIGCPRCKSTGRHYRRGATLVHRLRLSITAELREQLAHRANPDTVPAAREDN